MKTSLSHLPQHKQQELKRIVELAKEIVQPEMIILFGSFARGDWVEDEYKEGHITYSYQSDYDLLIIGKDKKISKNIPLLFKLEDEIRKQAGLHTPFSILIDSLDFVNEKLDEGRYFYADIRREGIMLYDSQNSTLHPVGKPNTAKLKQMAKEDLSNWMEKAKIALEDYQNNFDKGVKSGAYSNKAAFHLHQVAESLFTAIQLVFTGYRPKTHDLQKLLSYSVKCEPTLKEIFPFKTNEEKRLFELLRKAYIDARYRKDYKITQKELDYLAQRLKVLQEKIKTVCEKRIEEL